MAVNLNSSPMLPSMSSCANQTIDISPHMLRKGSPMKQRSKCDNTTDVSPSEFKRNIVCNGGLCSDPNAVSCCDLSTNPCCDFPADSSTCCDDACYEGSDDLCCDPGACDSSQSCCGTSCCDSGSTCFDSTTGTCTVANCGVTSCSPGTQSCCDQATNPCCASAPGAASCCGDGCYAGVNDICCNPGACAFDHECCGSGCCNPGFVCSNPNTVLCVAGSSMLIASVWLTAMMLMITKVLA